MEFTGYWTFFCNPAKWEIDRFLATNTEYDTYQIMSWQTKYFKPGQLGVIRVGTDRRTKNERNGRPKLNPGIYGIVQILTSTKYRKNKPDKFWRKWSEKELERPIVEIKYLCNLLNRPLLLDGLKGDEIINSDAYLIKGFQASSMPLKEGTFDRILEILGNRELVMENIEQESVATVEQIQKLEQKYQDAAPQVKDIISKRIERGALSKEIKRINSYKCQICEGLGGKPYSFRKANGELYIETHHVIPVSKLEKGALGILNLITVCANHHRQLHYGDVELINNERNFFEFRVDRQKLRIRKTKLDEVVKPPLVSLTLVTPRV